ncbi:low molecular weight phosphatase family protein [Marinobacter sp.]|uniref:arsenate-mycothiol transferase ArsC n=1 Tax=Marinobacter sp. TaxID=50741 RepID=UPI003A91AD76
MYEQFGSKQGFVRFFYHRALAFAGAYRKYSRGVDSVASRRLVFICSGNICRSPLAAVYARSLGMEAASCGLNCGDDYPADPRAQEFAREQGLSLDHHKTINVRNFDFKDSDLIVVMEPSHIDQFESKVGKSYSLVLAGSFCQTPIPYIHDPFNCCPAFFTRCESKVMECVRGLNA